MSSAAPMGRFYVTGGTMKPDAESYVCRDADEELFEAARAGEFCYVLTPRQMGKSSLMTRTAVRLKESGIRSAQVDLTLVGADKTSVTAEQWYYGVAYRIARGLEIPIQLDAWWRERGMLSEVQRMTEFLQDVVLAEKGLGKVVVFVDEIDSTIGLPFSDDFFAAIRACYNARANSPEFERLSFVLLGVATPAQLISDPTRTPFNIGRGIELTDFTREEALPLAKGLDADAVQGEGLLERVLHWTGGHPYLTQTLCRAVIERGDVGGRVEVVDQLVQERFFSADAAKEEANLKFVRGRLTQGEEDVRKVLQVYRKVVSGKVVKDAPASSVHAALKLSGVVKAGEGDRLRVRNRVYEQVFSGDWARKEMPADRRRYVLAAVLVCLMVVGAWYLGRRDPVVRELTDAGWTVGTSGKRWSISFKGVPNAKALRALRHIPAAELSVTGRGVSDISDLKELKELTSLDLSGTNVSSISVLKELKSLTRLNLGFTSLSNISVLKDLKRLTSLNLMLTQVSDISPLTELKSLTSLDLMWTKVSDISALSELKNLTLLDLMLTQVIDFSALNELKSLASLDVSSTNFEDMSVLTGLKGLTSLSLSNTKVSDFSVLKELTRLTKLDLGLLNVRDISVLKDLKSLKELDLRGTKVSNISLLKDLKSLTSLGLSRVDADAISVLKLVKSLTSLTIRGSDVADITVLKELTSLTSLDLRGTNVRDISALKELKGLTSLDLSDTPVSDVSALKDLTNLKTLDVSGTKVTDVSALKGLRGLEILGLAKRL